MRCSSVVCPFQRVGGGIYRQERSIERVGPFSQVWSDQGVRPALWSTTSHLGRSWSLLLRWLRVGSLGQFWLVWRLRGAAGPTPSRVMNRLSSRMPRISLEWRLWQLIERTSGPIDPSDPNLIHSIKPTFPWSISFIQVVPMGEEVCWTNGVPQAGEATPGRAGRTCRAGRAWWCGRA
jgi:hypothetical protein